MDCLIDPFTGTTTGYSKEGWVVSTRPGVLVFRVGDRAIMEPYFLHRFARNFGYDQSVPPNADFSIVQRVYERPDAHLVAATWWNLL